MASYCRYHSKNDWYGRTQKQESVICLMPNEDVGRMMLCCRECYQDVRKEAFWADWVRCQQSVQARRFSISMLLLRYVWDCSMCGAKKVAKYAHSSQLSSHCRPSQSKAYLSRMMAHVCSSWYECLQPVRTWHATYLLMDWRMLQTHLSTPWYRIQVTILCFSLCIIIYKWCAVRSSWGLSTLYIHFVHVYLCIVWCFTCRLPIYSMFACSQDELLATATFNWSLCNITWAYVDLWLLLFTSR
jgi:hypothetical protein